MRSRKNRRRRGGFTLLEVLLVLAILVVLGGMVGFYFAGIQGKAYSDVAKRQIETFEDMIELYRMHTGRYPTSASGLNALLQAPADLPNPKKWKGPYADEEIPLDPWDNPYRYEQVNASSFRITSDGEDMIQGTPDDISG